MDKKALSGVVVTILIVLIAIIAVVILWSALRPAIEEGAGSLDTSTGCLSLDLEIVDVVESDTDVNVSIKRNTGEGDLQKIKILFDGTSVGEEDASSLGELETKTFTVTDMTVPSKVEIAAMIGDDLTVCGVADTWTSSA